MGRHADLPIAGAPASPATARARCTASAHHARHGERTSGLASPGGPPHVTPTPTSPPAAAPASASPPATPPTPTSPPATPPAPSTGRSPSPPDAGAPTATPPPQPHTSAVTKGRPRSSVRRCRARERRDLAAHGQRHARRGAAHGAPSGEACPLCGAPLHPEQEWCLQLRRRGAHAPGGVAQLEGPPRGARRRGRAVARRARRRAREARRRHRLDDPARPPRP